MLCDHKQTCPCYITVPSKFYYILVLRVPSNGTVRLPYYCSTTLSLGLLFMCDKAFVMIVIKYWMI